MTDEPVKDGEAGALRLGPWILLLPGGRIYDVAARALVRRLDLPPFLMRGFLAFGRIGDEPIVFVADLRELTATRARSGETLWRRKLGTSVAGLAVITLRGRTFLAVNDIKKWGDGSSRLLDAHTGMDAHVDDPWRWFRRGLRFFSNPDVPDHFAVVENGRARLLRADGTEVTEIAWQPRSPVLDVSTSADGTRVTTLDLTTSPSELGLIHLDEGELFARDASRAFVLHFDGPPGWAVDLPADVRVRSVEKIAGESAYLALVMRASSAAVDLARIGPEGLTVLRPLCHGVALMRGELITDDLRVGPASMDASSMDLLPPWATASGVTPRAPGPIDVDPAIVAALARIRLVSSEDRPAGLPARAVCDTEAELGLALPSWVLALIAANTKAFSKRWSLGLQEISGHRNAVAAIEREHLASSEGGPHEPFPPGLIPFGKSTSTKKEQHGRRPARQTVRVTTTEYWCARGDESFLVRQVETVPLGFSDKPSGPPTFLASVSGPTTPLAVLTPYLDDLRTKKALSLGGDARVRDLEAQAVEALSSLPLTD